MDNTYITFINLNRNPDRRIFMEKQLDAFGFSYTRLEATDAKTYDFTNEFDEAEALRVNGSSLLPGIMGCSHSHRRALSEFLKTDKGFALIIEDDIEFDPIFEKAIKKTLADRHGGKETWDYLQFDYGPTGFKGIANWWFQFNLYVKVNKRSLLFWIKTPFFMMKAFVHHVISLYSGARDAYYKKRGTGAALRVIKSKYNTGCYVVTRDAATKLIPLNTPLKYSTDVWQNDARRLGIIAHYFYAPRLTRQKREEFISQIGLEGNLERKDNKAFAY